MILIFGMPRTGTHVLQQSIAHHFNITNYGELFGPYGKAVSLNGATQWLANNSEGVIKILAGQNGQNDLSSINENISKTHIVVLDRLNLADCCASLFYAWQQGQYHYRKHHTTRQLINFTVEQAWLEGWINHTMKSYYNTVSNWKANGIKFDYVLYEDMIADKNLNINGATFKLSDWRRLPTVPSDIDYANLCLNYKEIQAQINTALRV